MTNAFAGASQQKNCIVTLILTPFIITPLDTKYLASKTKFYNYSLLYFGLSLPQ